METFGTSALLIYAIISICVIGFSLSIVPALFMELVDRVGPLFHNMPMGWTVKIEYWFYDFAANIYEFIVDKDEERARHRRNEDDPDFFTRLVIEQREINEGRRTPMNING